MRDRKEKGLGPGALVEDVQHADLPRVADGAAQGFSSKSEKAFDVLAITRLHSERISRG